MSHVHTAPPFTERYAAALAVHLRRPRADGQRAAEELGRDAHALRLDGVTVARIHAQAASDLSPPRPDGARDGDDGRWRARADVFLDHALRRVAPEHAKLSSLDRRYKRLQASLRERNSTLVAARGYLRRQTEQRQKAQQTCDEVERRYRQLAKESRRLQDELRRLARKLITAQEDERRQISRELHDAVVQMLAGINVQLVTLEKQAVLNTRGWRQKLVRTRRLVEKSVAAIHRFARELRPPVLDDLGLMPALRSLAGEVQAAHHLRVHLSAFADIEELSPAQRTVLYRVAQEALTNVTRHAHAKVARLRIRKLPHGVELEVRDDGCSFDVARVLAASSHKRLGLLGMRERVEMAGGSFEITSAPGAGATVRAFLPTGRRARPPS